MKQRFRYKGWTVEQGRHGWTAKCEVSGEYFSPDLVKVVLFLDIKTQEDYPEASKRIKPLVKAFPETA